jgi:hypothetical protein
MQISYDYDKQADFSKYKTYGFSKQTKEMQVGQLNLERIVNAIDREMVLEGFTKSENPDVVVDVHVNITQEVQATATSTGMGYGGYGYSHYGYGGGFSTTQIDYNTYYEGTLFINFVDRSTEKIFWQGRGTKTIDQTATPEQREYNINKAVKNIFTKYPPYQKK